MDKKAEGYLFISLPIIIIGTFLIYPILASFIMSFQTKETNVFTLANYKRLLTDDVFVKTLFNTFIFLIIQVPFMLFLGLMIAYILNQKQIKGRSFFTFFFFLPAVTSLVSYSAIFKMMFQINGVINQFLIKVNLIAQPIDWLQTVNGARFVVIVALCWRWTGYNMIFYLSALQQLPVAQFEAAAIDGATKRQQFFSPYFTSVETYHLIYVYYINYWHFTIIRRSRQFNKRWSFSCNHDSFPTYIQLFFCLW